MAFLLDTPQTITQTLNRFSITKLENDIEDKNINIEYMIYLEDGTPYKRGRVMIEGYDAVKALYSQIDTVMATGKTFEEASSEILYNKVLETL